MYQIKTAVTNTRKKKSPRNNCLQVGLLSGLAFINSGRGGCSLRELYAFIVENFEGFDIRVEAWKKSIRHSLCTHVDVYIKASGEGNWMFKNQDLYYQKLNNYIEKNPNYFGYGLKNPHDWEAIRNGTKGLPVVLTREEQKLVARKRKAEEPTLTLRKKTRNMQPEVWTHYAPVALSSYREDVLKHSDVYYEPVYPEEMPYQDQCYYYNPVYFPYYNAQSSQAVEEDENPYYQQNEYDKPFETQPEAKLPLLTASFCEDVLTPTEEAPVLDSCYSEGPYLENRYNEVPYPESCYEVFEDSPYSIVPNYDCHYSYATTDSPYYHLPVGTYGGEF